MRIDHPEYEKLKRLLMTGWNTWHGRSVLTHVRLPEGLALHLGVKEYADGQYLSEALIGRTGPQEERVVPGLHATDGSYTQLTLTWRGIELDVRTAAEGADLVALVTPRHQALRTPVLTMSLAVLWNRPGYAQREGGRLVARLPEGEVSLHVTTAPVEDAQIPLMQPYVCVALDQPVGLSVGRKRSLVEIAELLECKKRQHERSLERLGSERELHRAVQTAMAWDTFYDPGLDRVISPVSRIWSAGSGGWVLFCWDTYFAAYLASVDSRELAYANAVEITRHMTAGGFVPNTTNAHGFVTRDRSQPPVGALVVRELYRRFKDRWLVEMLFPALLRWNRWWPAQRGNDGLLSWGSDSYAPVVGNEWETLEKGVGGRFGGALESGLDNSPMYDGIPFNAARHTLELQDVGLTGLYIMDCLALAELAEVLGEAQAGVELLDRAAIYEGNLQRLWDESAGIFANRRSDTGEFARRYSPTNFYALFARTVAPEQARRMIREHFYNPAEFWGNWIMPTIARNDPAYPDQDYWRGRIWAPLNFLVYLALRRHGLDDARRDLARKSAELLLREWREHGYICENYDGDTGRAAAKGCDRFYHWGALLGLIGLIEAGHLPGPEQPLE